MEKTFMPEPGDYISAVARLSDTDCKTYRGYVCRQAKGFSASPWASVPVVFDMNGKLLSYVTDVTVIRNHETVFSYSKRISQLVKSIVQDEDHTEFDLKHTPINIYPNKGVRNIIMKEANSVFDILLFNEKHYLIERIGPFVEGYDEVVALGYSRLSEKKPGHPEPAYFTIEKKFMPFLNQTEENPHS
jgi:hypothetical protein